MQDEWNAIPELLTAFANTPSFCSSEMKAVTAWVGPDTVTPSNEL